MTTPPPYGSAPGQPSGYSGQPGQPGQPYPQSYPGPASAPQPAYGQQQPAYGQQQPGYPPAGYPAGPAGAYPGFGGPAPLARPGMVTAAAVLAFVFGGFAVIASFFSLIATGLTSAVSAACDSVSSTDPNYNASCSSLGGYSGFFKVVAVGLILVAILLIWGGVVAMSGKNQQILVIGAGVYIILTIVSIIASSFGFTGILGVVAPILILVFLFNPASRAWFRAKGGKTF